MKQCSQCRRELPYSEYVRDKKSNDGFTGQCKACRNAKKKAYRERSKDKIKVYMDEYMIAYNERKRFARQQWEIEHKEELALLKTLKAILSAKRRKQYNFLHREENREKGRHHYRINRERILARMRDRYKNSPSIQFYNRQKKQKRKALLKSLPATLTRQQYEECLRFFNYECVYCGSKNNLTQEHLVPVKYHGSYTKHNIVPACSCCNLGRKAQPLDQWYRQQSFFSAKRLAKIKRWQFQEGQEGLFDII